ncbi:MAG: 30S ribosomal protein S20 [Patescibacteria group bacterium]
MPLIKSAINEMRKDKKKTARNRIRKEKMHTSIKIVEKLVKSKEAAGKISEAVKTAYQAIDKAAKKNLIHKKTAARRKSGVAKLAKAAAGKAK